MVTVFTRNNSRSSRLAVKWFEEKGIPYQERNVSKEPFTTEELLRIFQLSENGLEDVLSTSSNLYEAWAHQIEHMALSTLIDFIKDNPELLRYPLVENGRVLHIGFAEAGLGVFYPRDERARRLEEAMRRQGINNRGEKK